MGLVCSEIQEWVEEQIEQPVESFVGQWQETCKKQKCNWWCLCCNKWLCWLVWVVVRVITWVVVTIGKWVTRVVCEIGNFVLDTAGFLVSLVLSIPIIGGIIRTILNWLTEIIWRLITLPDLLLSLIGVRLRKKMYLGVVVPSVDGAPVTTDELVMRQVDAMIALYDSRCNIRVIFTGICHSGVAPPDEALNPGCDAGGFFHDWWLAGSYFEFATSLCKFLDSFRRIVGLGAQLVAFAVREVTPTATRGCSFGSTHNYVLVEFRATHPNFILSHEVGHSCWLTHSSDPPNLMFSSSPATNPQLTDWQVAVIRWSKHCVYI